MVGRCGKRKRCTLGGSAGDNRRHGQAAPWLGGLLRLARCHRSRGPLAGVEASRPRRRRRPSGRGFPLCPLPTARSPPFQVPSASRRGGLKTPWGLPVRLGSGAVGPVGGGSGRGPRGPRPRSLPQTPPFPSPGRRIPPGACGVSEHAPRGLLPRTAPWSYFPRPPRSLVTFVSRLDRLPEAPPAPPPPNHHGGAVRCGAVWWGGEEKRFAAPGAERKKS